MNTFKKIASVTLAAATLATTMITASAANFNFLTLRGNTYGANEADNVIHYSRLDKKGENVIKFTDVYRVMEGNSILSVDFTIPGEDYMSDETYYMSYDYMETLRLKDGTGKDLLKGQYTLVVEDGYGDYTNVNVSRNDIVFNALDMTRATYYNKGRSGGINWDTLTINYKIKNECVLPNFDVKVGSWSAPVASHDFVDQSYTTGVVEITIPATERGKTLDVTINGINVGRVTLPRVAGRTATIYNR